MHRDFSDSQTFQERVCEVVRESGQYKYCKDGRHFPNLDCLGFVFHFFGVDAKRHEKAGVVLWDNVVEWGVSKPFGFATLLLYQFPEQYHIAIATDNFNTVSFNEKGLNFAPQSDRFLRMHFVKAGRIKHDQVFS